MFGGKKEDTFYTYSDRFPTDQMDAAIAAATARSNTAAWWQQVVEHIRGRRVRLDHILAGSNLSSGYPYWVIGYKVLDG